MRALSLSLGLIGLATIAMGSEGVTFKAAALDKQASFTRDAGTSLATDVQLSISRHLKFYFPDGKRDKHDPTKMSPDSDETIKEYLGSDVDAAMADARQHSKDQKGYQKALEHNLSHLRVRTVDCRLVARDMVENLIAQRIALTHDGEAAEPRTYQERADERDAVLVEQQLDTVSITRDPSIASNDIEPRFTCRQTSVPSEAAVQYKFSADIAPQLDDEAACGDLRLKYNPLTAHDGIFKDEKAFKLPSNCMPDDAEQFRTCSRPFEIQACGLAYSEKAPAARSINPSTRGLSDFLEAHRRSRVKELEAGTFPKPKAAPITPAAAPKPPSPYLEEFKTPGRPGSMQPVG